MTKQSGKRKRRIKKPSNPFAKILKDKMFWQRRREDKRKKVLERWERDGE